LAHLISCAEPRLWRASRRLQPSPSVTDACTPPASSPAEAHDRSSMNLGPGLEPLLERIVAWANAEPNVLALVVTGAHAHPQETTDALSDLDVEVICEDPTPFEENDAWFHGLGEVWVGLAL